MKNEESSLQTEKGRLAIQVQNIDALKAKLESETAQLKSFRQALGNHKRILDSQKAEMVEFRATYDESRAKIRAAEAAASDTESELKRSKSDLSAEETKLLYVLEQQTQAFLIVDKAQDVLQDKTVQLMRLKTAKKPVQTRFRSSLLAKLNQKRIQTTNKFKIRKLEHQITNTEKRLAESEADLEEQKAVRKRQDDIVKEKRTALEKLRERLRSQQKAAEETRAAGEGVEKRFNAMGIKQRIAWDKISNLQDLIITKQSDISSITDALLRLEKTMASQRQQIEDIKESADVEVKLCIAETEHSLSGFGGSMGSMTPGSPMEVAV